MKIYRFINIVRWWLWLLEKGLKNIWFSVMFKKNMVMIKWVWCVLVICSDLLIWINVGSIVLMFNVIRDVIVVISVINLIRLSVGFCIIVVFLDMLLEVWGIKFWIWNKVGEIKKVWN